MNVTTAPADPDPRQNQALARYAAVQAVRQARQNGLSFTQALHHVAQQSWDGRYYAPATLEAWCYRYRDGQFAALHTKPRADKGTHKALDPTATEALISLRRTHPHLTVKALSTELLRQGILQPGTFSPSTLQRRLAEVGLDRRSLRAGAALVDGPTKAFELPLPNLLWMADCMHGPSLTLDTGSTQRTYLFALLDDCSRLCVHAQFYPHERLECFLDCLRQAIQTRGVPDKLYTDNGAAFRSQHLRIVCANLGTKLLHAKPYHSWSKGKLERFFRTLQTQFHPTLTFEPVACLDQLNRRFWRWLETDYHQREHGSLLGQSPAQRFATVGPTLRTPPTSPNLERLFLMRLPRRVRKDATISLGGQLWEVPVHLRGQIVTVHFDPVNWTCVELWIGDRCLGHAHRCNKHLNAQLRSSNDYERDWS
jgi:transposase InsO family protein